MKRKIPENTSYFNYENVNPKNRYTTDCVIRAISKVTNKNWDEIFDILTSLAKKLKSMPNDRSVYTKYIESVGFTKHTQPRNEFNKRMTIFDFIHNGYVSKDYVYICHTRNHLTAIVDNKIVDTWNCGNWVVGNYWSRKVEEIND